VRALVAYLSGGRARVTAFGAYHLVVGVAALVSSAGFGWAWDRFGSAPAFAGSAALAVAAAAALRWAVPAGPARPGA